MRLFLLLSSYNGERFLREQMESLLGQTLDGMEILARDDGSTDGTPAILEEYARQGKLRWTGGENLGAARSFWELLRNCGDADYYAFCDQDDLWDPDKLEAAVRALEAAEAGIPLLYCGDVRVTDEAGRLLADRLARREDADYPHALARNLAPGCTYVFNRAAAELLRRFDAEKLGIELHDWTAYQVTVCFGQVLFDPAPHMSYRQHGGNAIGAADRSARGWARKARSFLDGPMRGSRSRQALRLEAAYGDLMSPENRELTALFAHYREDPAKKKKLLRELRRRWKGKGRIPVELLIRAGRL